MSNLHRRLAVIALPAALALTLAACGGGTSAEPTPTTAATTMSSPTSAAIDASQAVADAVEATRAQGTAQAMFRVVATTDTDNVGWINEAEGRVDLVDAYSVIGWLSNTSPGVTNISVTPDGNFVRVGDNEAGEGGQWFGLAEGQDTPLLAAGDVLRGLDGLPFEANPGAEVSQPGTPYSAIVELDNAGILEHAKGMAISTEDPAVLSTADAGALAITVVVNEEGLITEVVRTLEFTWSGGAVRATSNVQILSFGVEASFTAPPADEVQPAPEPQQ